MRILLAEDDVALADAVCSYLRAKAYVVDVAPGLAQASAALHAAEYAAVLLDLHLSDGDGLALLPQVRALSMVLLVLLGIGAVWPWGFLRRLARRERVQLVLSILAAIAASTLVKRISSTSCPWDLAEFGGVARYVSHWSWGLRDGGGGHCFPAGHASAAFGFVAGWFVLRRAAPGVATGWLLAALAGGLVLGLAQQLRGAHYLSHTLWTAWICWTVGLVVESGVSGAAVRRHRQRVGLAKTKLNET